MSSYKLLFLPPRTRLTEQLFPPDVMKELQSLVSVTRNNRESQFSEEELKNCISQYDFCITGWKSPYFSPAVIKNAKRLKVILHSAGTVKPYISPDVFKKGIIVTNEQKIMSQTTAEAAVAMMMMGNWETKKWIKLLQKGGWREREETVPGIQGYTIGLIGFGSVTRILLNYLSPYKIESMLIYSKHLKEEEAKKLNLKKTTLNDLLSSSDIIFLLTSLTPDTYHLLNRENMRLIKPNSLLINIARGDIIEEEALIEYLQEKRFRAVLDVFSREPLPPDNPLRNMDNVISLPHIGAATIFCRENMGRDVVENLKEYLSGKIPHGSVSPESISLMSEK